MAKKLQTLDKFKFMTERSIRAEKDWLTHWQSAQLREITERTTPNSKI